MSAIKKLADILIEQNKIAETSWSTLKESGMTITSTIINYLQNLISYFPGEIDFLEKIGLQVSNEKERMRKIMKIFEKIKNEASISVTSLPKILQCLFEAEDLRLSLYQASLKIIELKKMNPIMQEYFGKVNVEIGLEPSNEVHSGRSIKAYVRVINLSSLLQKLKLYVAWYHPAHILSKYEEEHIELIPQGTVSKIYMHMPKAKGVHNIRVVVYKGTVEVASSCKAFEVV